ncbi:MAG TPA: hypothetical protein VN577_22500 [Terriglobales bacterium]|nr:hypothetical protein [Terriglobales bacterium]
MSLFSSLNRLRGRKLFDERVEHIEQVVQLPPFTPEIAAAVQLIATRITVKADEESRLLAQKEANAASLKEYEALAPVFAKKKKPRKVLEIGPGFGRSVIYFGKKGVWDDTAEIHLYDTNGTQTKYKQKFYDTPPKWPDVSSFCGHLPLLKQVLEYNGIHNFHVHDAATMPLTQLPGPYDFIYGFYSVGFHWSLDFYLDEIDPLLHERGLLVCTLNKHFRPFSRLANYSTRVVECPEIKKNASPLRLLLLSKRDLPDVGLPVAKVYR